MRYFEETGLDESMSPLKNRPDRYERAQAVRIVVPAFLPVVQSDGRQG